VTHKDEKFNIDVLTLCCSNPPSNTKGDGQDRLSNANQSSVLGKNRESGD
jgi:hypothetical protein